MNLFIKWISDFKNVALAILGILTAYTTYNNLRISNQMEEQIQLAELDREKLEGISEQVNIDINKKRFSNEQFLLLNREVRESLSHADCDQHLLLIMLVDEILSEDNISLRDSIRNIIKKRSGKDCSAKKYIAKEEQNENEFLDEQIMLVQSKPDTRAFRVDVFYLEDILTESKPRAKKIKILLELSGLGFDVRLRLMPKSINARKGYRIGDNQIRFDLVEREVAEKIQKLVNSENIFEFEPLRLAKINGKTENYISIFVRNM